MRFSVINFGKLIPKPETKKKERKGRESFHSRYFQFIYPRGKSSDGMPPVTVHPRRSIDSKNEIFPRLLFTMERDRAHSNKTSRPILLGVARRKLLLYY